MHVVDTVKCCCRWAASVVMLPTSLPAALHSQMLLFTMKHEWRDAKSAFYIFWAQENDQVICNFCRHTKSLYSFKLGAEIRRESLYSVAEWPLHLTVQRQSLRGLLDLQNWRWTKARTAEMTVCGSAGPQWSLSARHHLTSIPACPCTAQPVPHSLGPSFKDVYIISWRDHRVGNALCIILQCEYFILIVTENEK